MKTGLLLLFVLALPAAVQSQELTGADWDAALVQLDDAVEQAEDEPPPRPSSGTWDLMVSQLADARAMLLRARTDIETLQAQLEQAQTAPAAGLDWETIITTLVGQIILLLAAVKVFKTPPAAIAAAVAAVVETSDAARDEKLEVITVAVNHTTQALEAKNDAKLKALEERAAAAEELVRKLMGEATVKADLAAARASVPASAAAPPFPSSTPAPAQVEVVNTDASPVPVEGTRPARPGPGEET